MRHNKVIVARHRQALWSFALETCFVVLNEGSEVGGYPRLGMMLRSASSSSVWTLTVAEPSPFLAALDHTQLAKWSTSHRLHGLEGLEKMWIV